MLKSCSISTRSFTTGADHHLDHCGRSTEAGLRAAVSCSFLQTSETVDRQVALISCVVLGGVQKGRPEDLLQRSGSHPEPLLTSVVMIPANPEELTTQFSLEIVGHSR